MGTIGRREWMDVHLNLQIFGLVLLLNCLKLSNVNFTEILLVHCYFLIMQPVSAI